VSDPGVEVERLVDAEGNPWTAGQRAYDRENGRFCQTGLTQQAGSWNPPADARAWPGPDATNRVRDEETLAKCAAFRKRNAGQNTVPLYLAEVAANWTPDQQDRAWPGPAAQNYKGSSADSITRQDGKSRADLLHYAAEQFFLPPSSPAPTTPRDGENSSITSPNTSPPSVKRKLNPIFVEALMRWPSGLSGFERPATALIQWQQRMQGYLSALCSTPSEPAQGSLL
jgi:hypothetical protein